MNNLDDNLRWEIMWGFSATHLPKENANNESENNEQLLLLLELE